MNARPADPARDDQPTVNDRLKESFGSILWGAMIMATVLHFAVFALWPNMHVPVVSSRPPDMQGFDLEPTADFPPPPKPLSRPAKPEIASDPVDATLTMSRTDFDSFDVTSLPDPPKETNGGESEAPKFTPYTVGPSILNRDEVVRAMENAYPPTLRDAHIGGTVSLLIYIDEHGVVKDHRIAESSGYTELDSAAVKVLAVYRFSAALNRDKKTAVWVAFPIKFSVK